MQEELFNTNVNDLWMKNIFENLKNLENMERLARNGCESVMEYVQLPFNRRKIILAEAQYINLRLMVSEMQLLLTDTTPVLDEEEIQGFSDELDQISSIINNQKLFLKDEYSEVQGESVNSKPTEFFYKTLTFLSQMRKKIIKSMESLLFVKSNKPTQEILR